MFYIKYYEKCILKLSQLQSVTVFLICYLWNTDDSGCIRKTNDFLKNVFLNKNLKYYKYDFHSEKHPVHSKFIS